MLRVCVYEGMSVFFDFVTIFGPISAVSGECMAYAIHSIGN